MTIQDLGSIGEFVGAVAVVLSLLYLAIQVRQNTRSVRASTFQGVIDGWQELLLRGSQSDMARIFGQGSLDPSKLDAVFFVVMRACLRRYENDFYQWQGGTLDREAFEGFRRSLRAEFLQAPGVLKLWELDRGYFGPEFVAFIDAEIEQAVKDGGSLTERLQKLRQGE